MIDKNIANRLDTLWQELKEIMPDCNGSVTFHLAASDHCEPNVEIRWCRVTKQGTRKLR